MSKNPTTTPTLTQDQIQKLIVRELKNKEYRKTYNLRPDVKSKRKEYHAKRNRKIKQALALLAKQAG
jgi:hypothetical protein